MGTELKIIEPEIQDLQASSGTMLGQAAMLTVKDDASFTAGAEMLLEIKRIAKTVEARFEEPVSMAFKAHRAMTALRDSVLAPFRSAEATIKQKVGAYQIEVDRKRREEADRLRRQAEAQAEAERIAKAQDQMDKGDLKGCEQTLEAPAAPVSVRVETPGAPKVAGISFRDEWKFEITNVNEIPMEYLIPDVVAIGRVVKAMGSRTNIPGIRLFSEKVVAGRARVA